MERRTEGFDGFRDADAAPAAARRSLDHDGKADFLRKLPRFVRIRNTAFGTGHDGHARPLRRTRAAALSPMVRIVSPSGPTKINPAALPRLRNRILGEKAIAWMNCVCAVALARPERLRC